jgi:hypothetical protein
VSALGAAWSHLSTGAAPLAADAAQDAVSLLGDLGCRALSGRALDVRTLIHHDTAPTVTVRKALKKALGSGPCGFERPHHS